METKDQTKYQNTKSNLMWGKHPEKAIFSIVIPTYNRPGLLKEAIYSVLSQNNINDYEIVVVDNAADSKAYNSTYDLIKEIGDSRVVYYKNEKNIGIYGNTLRGYQLAHGEYVILLNDDDLLHPFYLSIMNQFIRKYELYGVIGSLPCDFSDKPKINQFPISIRAFSISDVSFFTGCCVTSPGFLFPRAILGEIYNAYEELLMGDQIIQYKALHKYNLFLIDYPIAFYRIGENETIKDNVLMDMMEHMCLFKMQIANNNFWLRMFMKVFYKNYYQLYVTSNAKFWHKEKLISQVLNKLGVNYCSENSIKQLIAERIVKFFSDNESKKTTKKSMYIHAHIFYSCEKGEVNVKYL